MKSYSIYLFLIIASKFSYGLVADHLGHLPRNDHKLWRVKRAVGNSPLAICGNTGQCTNHEMMTAFGQFKTIYKRDSLYKSGLLSEVTAIQNFNSNLDILHKLKTSNAGQSDSTPFGITKLFDFTMNELIDYNGGGLPEPDAKPYKAKGKYLSTWKKNTSLDWRDHAVVPAIRDQKQCAASYAFAISDLVTIQRNIDLQRKIKKSENVSYSAQFILDCFRSPEAMGCDGGRPAAIMKHLVDCGDKCALPSEKCYQYKNKENTCAKDACSRSKSGKVKKSFFLRLIPSQEKETMANLLRWGAAIAMVELSPAWQMYNGKGIIRQHHCTGKKPNHAIVLVGYDYTGPVPYYIVRNSWGDDWGDMGYAKVEAGKNTCGIGDGVTVTCLDNNCDKMKNPDYMVEHPNSPV